MNLYLGEQLIFKRKTNNFNIKNFKNPKFVKSITSLYDVDENDCLGKGA